jgi:hypothetical protein
MNSKRNGLPGALLAMAGMVLLAAPQLVQSALPSGDEELDEVTVSGTPIYRMRAELASLENRFYERYNQLNKDKDFDIHCYTEASLGTRFRSRVCRVAYVEEAQAEWTQLYLAGMATAALNYNGPNGAFGDSMPGAEAPDPGTVELIRQKEYRANALKVINGDKQLLRLVRERAALEKRYLAELKRRSKEQPGNP